MNSNKEIISDLGDGLVLRRATKEDTDALAKFNGTVHGIKEYDTSLDIMVREMMSGTHPHITPKDFTIVEEVETGKIVSSLNLIGQTWAYDGIEFGVGRPELVATLEEYRRKGLVRKQMDLIHQWSKERGHLVQAITGIPWYYSKFDYEMTVNLGGGQHIDVLDIPKIKKKEEEIISIRKATNDDIPFLKELYRKSNQRGLLNCKRSTKMWKHEIRGRFQEGMGTTIIKIIENLSGQPIGLIFHEGLLWGERLAINNYELIEGISWLEITPGVLRHLKVTAEDYLVLDNEKSKKKSEEEKKDFTAKELRHLYLYFGEEHPFYTVFPNLLIKKIKPYAWFMRVEDLPAFLNLIKPVLEKRLAESHLVGYTGELKLNFYTYGIIIKFEKGRISSIEKIGDPDANKSCASFPNLTFLHILFGYRDIDELTDSMADCYILRKKPEAKVLLKILFPKKPSHIWPIM